MKIFNLLLTAGYLTSSSYAESVKPDFFEEPFAVEAGGKILSTMTPGYAAPVTWDLDGDGLEDLIVGQFYRGEVKFYKNTGTTTAPKYAKGIPLTINGEHKFAVTGIS